MAILLLAAAEELKRVGPKLQSTSQIWDEAILNCRLTRLSKGSDKRETGDNTEYRAKTNCH